MNASSSYYRFVAVTRIYRSVVNVEADYTSDILKLSKLFNKSIYFTYHSIQFNIFNDIKT